MEVGTSTRKRGTSLGDILRQTWSRARGGHLPVSRQCLEMVILKLFYGLGPGHYHIAGYWRRGLSWNFKTGFWPYRKFRRVINGINPPPYQKISQNKVCEKALLCLFDIPTPRFIGSLHCQWGMSSGGFRLTCSDELHRLLVEKPELRRICCKPVEGYGGNGFCAADILRGNTIRLRSIDSGEVLTVPQFLFAVLKLQEGAGYIVEEFIQQHLELSRLNPSSVNTLRVWVSCINGETAVIDAFLRVGRRGSLVDNTSRGAQIFRMDLSSGVIGDGMAKTVHNDRFQCHRDSGERITGSVLPYWRDVLNLSQQAVRCFPHIGFAGVDIAITDQGPVVIELNVEPDPTSAIVFDRSHRELLSCFTDTAA